MGRPKQFCRDDVLTKAIPLFWRQGFADTSLQDLEKATGVNKSGLYAEFESKDALFIASLRHYIDNRGTKALLRAEPFGWDNIDAFLRVRRCEPDLGCFAVNTMRETALLPPEAVKVVNDNWAVLRRLIETNVAAEKTSMPAAQIADVVMTFFFGFCLEQNLGLSQAAKKRKVDGVMAMLRGL